MSRSVTYKLRGQALEAALKFSQDLGMPLNYAAERALLWAIKQAYQPEGGTIVPTPYSAGTPEPVPGSTNSVVGVLAEQATNAAQGPEGHGSAAQGSKEVAMEG